MQQKNIIDFSYFKNYVLKKSKYEKKIAKIEIRSMFWLTFKGTKLISENKIG